MDSSEISKRFGISSKLAYGLFIQSLLVIFALVVSLWGIFALINKGDFSLRFATNLFSILVCISLLIYSFYGFNAKKNQEAFFISSIVLYIILIILGLFTSVFNYRNPVSLLSLISLIATVFFLHEYVRNYKSANYAMLVVIILSVIVLIFNILGGMPWITAIKYIIIPVSIGLTYFERVQRGKYHF